MLQAAGKTKKVRDVLKSASEHIPSSAELWQLRLRFLLSRDEETAAEDVFQSALNHLGMSNLLIQVIKMSLCHTVLIFCVCGI